MKITAAVLRKTGAEISLEELELESPRESEVLVALKASGICHSDYNIVTGDAVHELLGNWKIELPDDYPQNIFLV